MGKSKSEKYLNAIDNNSFKEIKKLFYILLVIFVILIPIYILLQLSSNKKDNIKIENKYNEKFMEDFEKSKGYLQKMEGYLQKRLDKHLFLIKAENIMLLFMIILIKS